MNLDEFEGIVSEVVKNLPDEFKTQMENVSIVVDIWPTPEEMESIKAHPGTLLFGLYTGIPKSKRLSSSYQNLPDRITIYAGPILMISKDLEDAKQRIKATVQHEIGHHFGLTEEQIRKAVEQNEI